MAIGFSRCLACQFYCMEVDEREDVFEVDALQFGVQCVALQLRRTAFDADESVALTHAEAVDLQRAVVVGHVAWVDGPQCVADDEVRWQDAPFESLLPVAVLPQA